MLALEVALCDDVDVTVDDVDVKVNDVDLTVDVTTHNVMVDVLIAHTQR